MLDFSIYAQDLDSVQFFINQGISLHDKGDYTGAISNSEKAPLPDEDNMTALVEKAYTLFSIKDYNSSIKTCQQANKF